jgi:hypothetical protein
MLTLLYIALPKLMVVVFMEKSYNILMIQLAQGVFFSCIQALKFYPLNGNWLVIQFSLENDGKSTFAQLAFQIHFPRNTIITLHGSCVECKNETE